MSLLSLNKFHDCSGVSTVDFEQINDGWTTDVFLRVSTAAFLRWYYTLTQ